jgi:hypothetical protein
LVSSGHLQPGRLALPEQRMNMRTLFVKH